MFHLYPGTYLPSGRITISRLNPYSRHIFKSYIVEKTLFFTVRHDKKQISELDCSNNQITKLENLPIILTLDCSNNQITKLENLPIGLTELGCSYNQIIKLENLPNTLTYLECYRNQITKLENLSILLTKLDCHNNQISKLENLPVLLIYLECSNNQITKLENLPVGLNELGCSNNQIIKLENLPNRLTYLYCEYNLFTKLENLPLSLNYIFFINDITHIDNLEISWFKSTRDELLEQYNRIRFMQLRYKLKFRCRRTRAAIKIQRACHNWLWSPKCKDGTVGISCRIAWRNIQEIQNSVL